MKHLALIGDIIDSRLIGNRSDIQERFMLACDGLNKRYSHYGIVSPLMVTLGDEFQGVIGRVENLWPLIARLELELFPHQFRFSIGLGEITTQLNTSSSLGMDGPAFYNAREGIETLRKQGGFYQITGLTGSEKLIQLTLQLWSAARLKWNYNRVATFTYLLEGKSVSDIASVLGVSEQAVYRTRRDGDLDVVIALLKEINGVVARELEDG